MTPKYEFVVREVAGETLLIPVGTATLSLNGMVVLNGCGKFLWEQLPGAESEASLVEALLNEYDVDRATASQDVREFLDSLRKHDII